MLFNSIEYIFFFFPAVFILVKLISFFNFNFLSKVFLICASLYFYSFWNIKFLPLILISVLGNLFFIKILEKKKLIYFYKYCLIYFYFLHSSILILPLTK